jgi:PAS domain S-box-containing protein
MEATQNVDEVQALKNRVGELEKALQEKEQQLAQIVAHNPMSIAMFDTDMRYLAANKTWMSGYNLGDRNIMGLTHYEVFPEIGEDWKAIHRRCLAGDIDRNPEAAFPRADGSLDWLSWEVRPWHKANGEIGGLVMYTEVITERVKAREAVQQTQQMYQQILDAITDMVLVKGEKSRIVWANKSFRDYYGMTNEQMRDMIDASFNEPDNTLQYIKDDAQVYESGKPLNIPEEPVTRHDGEVRQFNTVKSPIFGEQGKTTMTVGVSRDITERKRAEKERERLIRELEEALMFKDHFLATMSHELRTPLNAVLGFAGIALMRDDVSDPIIMMLERIKLNSKRLLNLINDILDISRINSKRIEIVTRPVNLPELIRGWHQDFRQLAEEKGLALEFSLDPKLPATIIGDEERLTQITGNLVNNALKFTEKGKIEIITEHRNNQWAIIIKDTGIGIPDIWQHLIFEEFRQVDSSSRRKYGGAGLGLSIVQKLCILMGGDVTVASKPGEGSTFTVTLPITLPTSSN